MTKGPYNINDIVEKINNTSVETIAALRTTATNPSNRITVRSYYSGGQLGGGLFQWDAANTSPDNGGTIIQVTGISTGRWIRVLDGFVTPEMFGARGDGITNDRVPMQACINYAGTSGLGVVVLLPVTYSITASGGLGLTISHSKILIKGTQGRTKLTRPTASNTSLFIAVGIHPATSGNNGTVAFEDITIDGVEFDGNYVVNTSNDRTIDAHLLKMQGVRRFTLRNCYLHGSRDYGIAFQNGGHIDYLIENVVVEDCLHDGLDVKNNGSSDEGGRINNCVFRRCSQGVIPSTPACVDVMGSVTLSNIHVYDFGQVNAAFGIRFKQGELADGRGLGAHGSSLTNFVIRGQKTTPTVITNNNSEGLRLTAYSVSVSNGYISNVNGSGVVVAEKEQQINNVSVSHCFDGFLAPTQFGSTLESANRSLLSNCVARSCTTGYRILVSGIYISNSVARSNNTGLNVATGVNQFIWQGGNISNSVGSNIIDNSSAGIINNVTQV